jgi:hypothetical protein
LSVSGPSDGQSGPERKPVVPVLHATRNRFKTCYCLPEPIHTKQPPGRARESGGALMTKASFWAGRVARDSRGVSCTRDTRCSRFLESETGVNRKPVLIAGCNWFCGCCCPSLHISLSLCPRVSALNFPPTFVWARLRHNMPSALVNSKLSVCHLNMWMPVVTVTSRRF